MTEIQKMLWEYQDVAYRDFHSRLMPNIKKETVIGIRVPVLRKLAKQLNQEKDIEVFLEALPHTYYEENNLHAFLIAEMSDYENCLQALDKFLPYIDNWATCDMLSPKVFQKHLPELEKKIPEWLSADETYTKRFGISMLMKWFLDENFSEKYLDWVIDTVSEEYYVNMMRAWYFATALAKQYPSALARIEKGALDVWTHNKAIQKAVESKRITKEQKAVLKKFKK